MRNAKWVIALVALMALGMIAAGCGSSNDTSSTAASTTATESSSTTGGSSSTTSSGGSGGATSADVLKACEDAIKGTPAESAGQTACQQAADAFDQCNQQAASSPEGSARD